MNLEYTFSVLKPSCLVPRMYIKKHLKVKSKYIEQFIYSSQETLVVMVKRHHCKIK